MTTRLALLALALALGAAGSLSGCVVAAAGTRTAGQAYVMGSLDGSMPASPERIVEASKDVLEGSDIHILSSDASSLDGTVVGRTALDRKIEITVKRVDERQSKVSIRVGTSGDKDVSQGLFDRIKAKVT
jgi:hypothetical protein